MAGLLVVVAVGVGGLLLVGLVQVLVIADAAENVVLVVFATLPYALGGGAVIAAGWWTGDWLAADRPVLAVVVRAGAIVVVVAAAMLLGLRVPLRRRRLARRLRRAGMIAAGEVVDVALRGRLQRTYGPRRGGRGLVAELCPMGAPARVHLARTEEWLFVLGRSGVGRLPARRLLGVVMEREAVSFRRRRRGRTDDVDGLRRMNFGADEMALRLADESGVYLTATPSSEVDRLRGVSGDEL